MPKVGPACNPRGLLLTGELQPTEVEEPLLQGCAGLPEDVVPLGNFLQECLNDGT